VKAFFHSLLFLFLLLHGGTAYAQKIRYTTQSCALSAPEKRKIEAVAHYEKDFFEAVFGAKKLAPIYISICGTRKIYKRKDPPRGSAGFYSPRKKSIAVLYTTDFMSTCYHECSHALFHAFAKQRPTWLDEGIATYFEQAAVDSAGTVTILSSRSRFAEMKQIVTEKHFSIVPLTGYSHKRFHRWREHRHYTLSWGIVYFLMRQHRETFGTIVYRIGTGTPSLKAINDEYDGGVPQLEKDLVAFYK
jgi:hypothetical protein